MDKTHHEATKDTKKGSKISLQRFCLVSKLKPEFLRFWLSFVIFVASWWIGV